MSKRILITGATGYLGSHTIVELIEAGYDVIGVDNFSNSNPTVLKGIESIVGRPIDFVELDCTDHDSLWRVFEQYPDICAAVHFAAYKAVGESTQQPLKYYYNNLTSLMNLLNCLIKHTGSGNLVFSSSATVYGEVPIENIPIKETTQVKSATSPYGETKIMAEQMIRACTLAYDLKAVILRYFNPIGAHPSSKIGETPNGIPNNLVPYITQTAIGLRESLNIYGNDYNTPDGTCIRDYIYVVDLAKAHVKAIDRLLSSDKSISIYNLGTGKGYSVLELVNEFIKVTGVTIKYQIVGRRPGDTGTTYADPSKANAELNWVADTSLGTALLTSWNWQKNSTIK